MQSLAVVQPQLDSDVLGMLLADRRSENTKAAYAYDIGRFFFAAFGNENDREDIKTFLMLKREQALSLVLRYKADLIRSGLAEATINRRLSALKSFAKFACKLGHCNWTLDDVQGERVRAYRDTSGVDDQGMVALLQTPNRAKLKGKRDYCILRLLWECALRRGEVVKCNKQDFSPEDKTLAIMGKGYGSQKILITISDKTVEAINEWLEARDDEEEALFIALDNVNRGHRLTGEAVAYIVKKAGQKAGISKALSPHRIRHSAITSALNHTSGDVRRVQKLSRHAKVETLLLYDDSRQDFQGEITTILAALA